MEHSTPEKAGGATETPPTMAISREMVALMKEYLGRGPTHARTYIRDNLVVCVMHDTMTKAEHSLADTEKHSVVREIRRLFQETLRERAIDIIERNLGRKVISFMSDHDISTDHAAEIFVLEPEARQDVGGAVGQDGNPPA
jgi:uncharacterized protein YbcI